MLRASNKVITRKLVITESTVKVHMKAILRKLRLQNRTQAAIWARGRISVSCSGTPLNAVRKAERRRRGAVLQIRVVE
jgi:two-component system nitrate/nitrite response regulator NarL